MNTPNIIQTQSVLKAPPVEDLSLVLGFKILPPTSESSQPFFGIWLLDLSKSMEDNNKIDAAKESLKEQVERLPKGTIFNLVSFGNPVQVHLKGIEINKHNKREITRAIDDLTPFGSTPLHAGLKKAFNILEEYKGNLETQKIILVGDGQPDFGCSREDVNNPQFKGYIKYAKKSRDLGASIDSIGVGEEHNVLLMYQFAVQSTGKYIFADNAPQLKSKLSIATNQITKILYSNPTMTIEPVAGTCNVFDCIQYSPTTIRYPFEKIGKNWKAWLRSFEAGDTIEMMVKIQTHLNISSLQQGKSNQILKIKFNFGQNLETTLPVNVHLVQNPKEAKINKNMLNKFKRINSKADEIDDCTIKGDAQGTIMVQKDETQKH